MNSSAEALLQAQTPSAEDLVAMSAAVRQVHAQIRLLTAANFAGFLELSRSEQLDALLALLSASESTIDLLDQLPLPHNPH